MKASIFKTLIVANILLITFTSTSSFAWNGDTWGPISRETIVRIADEMIDFSWSPQNTFKQWGYTFNPGSIYRGEAYTKDNPQENWVEFYSCMDNNPNNDYVSGCSQNPQNLGNDCSGFVSISWKLKKRYTTEDFECDAMNKPSPCGNYYNSSTDDFVTKLGDTGKGKTAGLLRGDALNNPGVHIILFDYYELDGVESMEQTPGQRTSSKEMRQYWSWTRLASYRPIRRNDVQDYVFTTKWGSEGTGNGQLQYPEGIAVDSQGYVYVADTGNYRIQKFNSSGGYITKWGSYGSGNGQFKYPTGIAVDSSANVYVTDSGNACVQKFTSNGGFITWWFSTYRDNDVTWGYAPDDIAVDLSGIVYEVDDYPALIQKFTSNGSFITQWGSKGSGDGQFIYPHGITVDSSGNVYIADSGNYRIQKLTSNGGFITKWGSYGSGDGQFNYPYDSAVDSSLNVYVADTGNNRIQKFSLYPSAPSNLTATAVSSSQIILSWQDNSNNETGFKIKRKSGIKGTYSTIATVGANVTSCSDIGLTADEIYYYSVWAYNGAGDSAYSNEADATIGESPAAPSNLTATAISSPKQIKLSWQDNSNNERGFKIERKTGIAGTYLKIATVGAGVINYTDTNISEDITYYYRVSAYNNVGDSAYSNEANAAIVTGRLPADPSNLNARDIGSCLFSPRERIYLTWTDNSNNEEGFKIERKRIETGEPYSQIDILRANSRSYAKCEIDDYTYCYRIRAYNANGNSDYSNEVCINIP